MGSVILAFLGGAFGGGLFVGYKSMVHYETPNKNRTLIGFKQKQKPIINKKETTR